MYAKKCACIDIRSSAKTRRLLVATGSSESASIRLHCSWDDWNELWLKYCMGRRFVLNMEWTQKRVKVSALWADTMCQPWVRHITHNTETPQNSTHGDDRQVHSKELINWVSPMGLTKYHKLLTYKRSHGVDMFAPWVSCCCHLYCQPHGAYICPPHGVKP